MCTVFWGRSSVDSRCPPASLNVAEAPRDLASLGELRPRTYRLRQLLGRADDTEMALGSDVMSAFRSIART